MRTSARKSVACGALAVCDVCLSTSPAFSPMLQWLESATNSKVMEQGLSSEVDAQMD